MMVGTYRRLRELIADLGVRCARRRKLPAEPLPKLVLSRLGLIGGNNGQGRSFMSHLRALTPDCWEGGPCACGACGWDASRFRRVRPIRTEQLDVFRAMLGSENELAG